MTMNSNSPRYSRLAICSTMAKKSQRAKFSLVKGDTPRPCKMSRPKMDPCPRRNNPHSLSVARLGIFRGFPLGLDMFPGASGAGRGLEAKRSTGNTRGDTGQVTVDQAADRNSRSEER